MIEKDDFLFEEVTEQEFMANQATNWVASNCVSMHCLPSRSCKIVNANDVEEWGAFLEINAGVVQY